MSSSEQLRSSRWAVGPVDGLVVDADVTPAFPDDDGLREYMREPYRSRGFSGSARWYYPAPVSEYLEGLEERGAPGSDPATVAADVLDGADVAVLNPHTRGLMHDIDVANDVCAATNSWLAERWLDADHGHDQFRGTIRINAEDPPSAIAEIERWAEHPRMVQVGVTMQSRAPYGQRGYRSIWKAAAGAGLPVVIKNDRSDGINFPPTARGYPTHFIEFVSQAPLNCSHHLISFIMEGVFEEIPDLRIVFADGGVDIAIPIAWRADKDWRPSRAEVPWVSRCPTAYLADHVRFVMSPFEGPVAPDDMARWLEMVDGAELLLFGSGYPFARAWDPRRFTAVPAAVMEAIAGGNARALYAMQ